jgi:hypothetical protein
MAGVCLLAGGVGGEEKESEGGEDGQGVAHKGIVPKILW